MSISDARHRANEKYNAKAYDEIKVRVAKGRKEEIQAEAERRGQSVNGFINSLIDEALERERAPTEQSQGSAGACFPYFSDGEDTPPVAVGSPPIQDEESSPAEQIFPDLEDDEELS